MAVCVSVVATVSRGDSNNVVSPCIAMITTLTDSPGVMPGTWTDRSYTS